jgi:hypothetical protein
MIRRVSLARRTTCKTMPRNDPTPDAGDVVGRRTVLRATAAAGTVVGCAGVVGAARAGRSNGNGNGNGNGNPGFPPDGITEWSEPVTLGEGEVRTFTSVTPSDEPKYHGVSLDRAALDGLPDATKLENATDDYPDKYGEDGEALQIHGKWTLEFFVPFPDTDATPFTFLGLNWNPQGHSGGQGAWLREHFDLHFHLFPSDVVDAVTGPREPDYELPDRYVPEGYARPPESVSDERVITDMGEHLAPLDAPELPGNPDAFTNTLIWGVNDRDADDTDGGVAEPAYVEPMVTREYLREHSGVDASDITQPGAYPNSGNYPTSYSVRDVPSDDAIAVTVEEFEFVDGEE